MELTSASGHLPIPDCPDVTIPRTALHAAVLASYLPALSTALPRRRRRPRFPGQRLVLAGLACWALAELLDALRLPLLADNTPLVLFLVQPGLSLLLAGLLRLARVPLATLQVTLVGAPTLAGWAPLLVAPLALGLPDSLGYALGNFVATLACLAVLLGSLRVAVPSGQDHATLWVAVGILLHAGPDVLYPLIVKLYWTERSAGGLWQHVILARMAHTLAGTYCLTRGLMLPRG